MHIATAYLTSSTDHQYNISSLSIGYPKISLKYCIKDASCNQFFLMERINDSPII